ncbi:S24 family peptidase [Lactococcus garvieae]|uniref:S24 family peptidase n=1 Tax=Lactococcus garvieae TaxID=1363 RepID=UPI000309AFA2|nr:S24 family peptidase [Lactococcus garvieae]
MKTDTSNRLKQIMSERNLKQVDILNLSNPYQKKYRIKLSKSTLSQYVNGVQSPDQHRIFLLAKTLGVSEAWLMGFDVPMIESERPKPPTPIVEEITKVSSQLEEPRQQVVLDTATSQLKEQKAVKREKKMLPFKKMQLDKINNLVPYDHDQEGFAPVIGEIAAGTPIFSEQNFEGMRPVYGKYAGRDDVFWLHVKGDSMESEIHDGSFALILLSPDIDDGAIGAVRFTDDNSATLKCVHYEYDVAGYVKRIRLEPLNPKYPIQYADESNPAEIAGRLVKVEQDY